MLPAYERLDASDGSTGQRHLRLEIDLEGLFRDGETQIVLELLAVLQSRRSSSEKNE